jgi:hypothetical protein
MPSSYTWPAANEYMQAIQNPQICFADQTSLRQGKPALDKLGMPVVMSGNFAYVFKLQFAGRARAIKCFRQFLGDRESRYVAIDTHLDAHRLPALAQFEYDPDGISVAGRRYPILIMEWCDGNTLDVYVGSLIKQQKAKGNLKPLADQWAELVHKLEASDMAHGDLQHGNVVVTPSGFLKLVDLDGMYVPALNGRQMTELGHIHFQHPKRAQAPFDTRLDKFSSLVIYLSLLALDQEPRLWDEFHDDNLIFTKDDFLDPGRSKLFREIKRQGGEMTRLATILESACAAPSPAAMPSLSSLVQVKQSKLPEWMRQPTVVSVQTKTREATTRQQAAAATGLPAAVTQASSSTTPAWGRVSTTPTPSTVVYSPPASRQAFREWVPQGLVAAVNFGFYGLVLVFLWGPPLQALARRLGATRSDSGVVAFFLYAAICLAIGLWYAKATTGTGSSRTGPSTRTVRPSIPTSASSPGSRVVGSSIRFIYHRPGCDWAAKISHRNRIAFGSAHEAANRGYRPCRVCNP